MSLLRSNLADVVGRFVTVGAMLRPYLHMPEKPRQGDFNMKDSDASTGDRIVYRRHDGTYDVLGLDADRSREVRREGLTDLKVAYEIARAGLQDSGGKKVWYCDYREPESIEPYRI